MRYGKNIHNICTKLILEKASFLYRKMIKPNSSNSDIARREFILNVILLATILLSMATVVDLLVQGIDCHKSLIAMGLFVFLYFLSRIGKSIASSYIIILFCVIFTIRISYIWGADLPQAILAYALIIIMAGILISTRVAFVVTFIISSILMTLGYLQTKLIIKPNLYWTKDDAPLMGDVIIMVVTFNVIAILTWLSNSEIERSLRRARKSEAELKMERDMLEFRVQERTAELKKEQAEKMNQAAKFIEFGKLSSGLFHDLSNHITFLFLNIEKIASYPEKEIGEAKKYLRQIKSIKHGIDNYLVAIKRQFQKQDQDAEFSLQDELVNVMRVLEYRAKMLDVSFKLTSDRDIRTLGNALKFNRIISNLIINALDAYEENPDIKKRQILVDMVDMDDVAKIFVQDWADGIDKDVLDNIFDPFYSTKKSNGGTGIGLAIVKDSLVNDFSGVINVESQKGIGTKFIIKFPITNAQR